MNYGTSYFESERYESLAFVRREDPRRFTVRSLVAVLSAIFLIIVSVFVYGCYARSRGGDEQIESYDYIIIGAGPSGSVFAERLSADESNRVLLIEAGSWSQFDLGGSDFVSYPLTYFDVPLLWPKVSQMDDIHWHIEDSTAKGAPQALVAKAVGGCGIHNGMLYVRAIEEDFQMWNVTGWDWETALNYYKSIENFDPTAGGRLQPAEVPEWHGVDGPINSAPPFWLDKVAPLFLDACEALGVPFSADFNEPGRRLGAGLYHFNIKDGIRHSASSALLSPIIKKENRSNLKIITEAEVRSIQLESSRSSLGRAENLISASGVRYERFGKSFEAVLDRSGRRRDRERRSVVLTAGALNTPKILMASGIGDRAALEGSNITCTVDLPGVGKNLQDHPVVGLMFEAAEGLLEEYNSTVQLEQAVEVYKKKVLLSMTANLPDQSPSNAAEWSNKMKQATSPFGLLSSTGLSSGAFLRSPFATNGVPDVQLTLFSHANEPHMEMLNHTKPEDTSVPTILITAALLSPEGRRNVHLNTSDPIRGEPFIGTDSSVPPLTDRDIERLAWGVQQILEIQKQSALKNVTGRHMTPQMWEGMSFDEIKEWVREHHYNNSHWCGTAKMADSSSDPLAVVDGRLKVNGVNNLYVGDASIMPHIPNGNVHSTVVLISSYGADMLLERR